MESVDEAIGRDGDFAAFYAKEFVRAARLAHLLTGSNVVAEDIAQDTMLRVRDRLAEIDRPDAYLTRAITNACWNWHRAQGRAARRDERLTPLPASDEPELDHLLGFVDELPYRQRTVLVARYWLDLSESEIAELVGCRPGTVKSLAARALRTLKGQLS